MILPRHTTILTLLLYLKIVNSVAYNGTIAGHKTVAECINGPKISKSELEMTTVRIFVFYTIIYI